MLESLLKHLNAINPLYFQLPGWVQCHFIYPTNEVEDSSWTFEGYKGHRIPVGEGQCCFYLIFLSGWIPFSKLFSAWKQPLPSLLLKNSYKCETLFTWQICSPLLILHGAADLVTDPHVSEFLYEKASTKDKTLKLYEDGYHSILEGEPDDRISTAINDIISWLDSHCWIPLYIVLLICCAVSI